MKPYVTPRALETAEIPGIVEDFRQGAVTPRGRIRRRRMHAANGYLLDQFLRDGTNKRTDRYGGNASNRARFLIEVTEAVVGVWGGERVGVRLSPTNPYNELRTAIRPRHSQPQRMNSPARARLSAHRRTRPGRSGPRGRNARINSSENCGAARSSPTRATISHAPTPRFTTATPTWSRSPRFISPIRTRERLRRGGPFNPAERKTFYGGAAKGYTDCPALT